MRAYRPPQSGSGNIKNAQPNSLSSVPSQISPSSPNQNYESSSAPKEFSNNVPPPPPTAPTLPQTYQHNNLYQQPQVPNPTPINSSIQSPYQNDYQQMSRNPGLPPQVQPQMTPQMPPQMPPYMPPQIQPQMAPQMPPYMPPQIQPQMAPQISPYMPPQRQPQIPPQMPPQQSMQYGYQQPIYSNVSQNPYGYNTNMQSFPKQNEGFIYNEVVNASVTQTYASLSSGISQISGKSAEINKEKDIIPIPTLKPNVCADINADANVMNRALKSGDKNLVSNLLPRRTSAQRQNLKIVFFQSFNKDLIKACQEKFSGSYEEIVTCLLYAGAELDAYFLKKATKGVVTNDNAFREILCTKSFSQIEEIKVSYIKLFGKDLGYMIKQETSGNFQKILLTLCQVQRDGSSYVDQTLASKDASQMSDLLKKGKTTAETFIPILTERNFSQLLFTFQLFSQFHGKDFAKAVRKTGKGDYEQTLLSIFYYITDPTKYYAKQLRRGIDKGSYNQIIRVVVPRCEFDLGTIISCYDKNYKSFIDADLKKAFSSSSHSDFLNLINILIGKC